MVPVNDIVHCLLCRGVVTFSDEAQGSIYKDHLKREHRAYFYVNWIVKKTLTEADNENKNKTDIRNYFNKKSPVLGEVKTQGKDGNNLATQSESRDTTSEISSIADSKGQIEDLVQNENKQSSFETGSSPIMMEDISAIEDVRIDDANIDDTEDFIEIEDSIDNFTLKSFEQSNSESFEDSTVSSFDDVSADLMDINNSTSEPSGDFVDTDDSDFMNDSTFESLGDSNVDTFDDSSFDDTNADLLDDSSMDDSMLNSHLLESEESSEGTLGTTVTLSDHSLKTGLENVPNKPDASNETIEISSFTDSEATQVSMQSSDNFENSTSIAEDSNAKSGDDQCNDEMNLVSIADPLPSLNEDPQKDVDAKLCESVDSAIEKDLILQPCEESNVEHNEKSEEDKGEASVKPFETFIARSSEDSKADPCEVYSSEHHDNLEQSKDEFSVIQQTDNVSLCDNSKIISGEVDQAKPYDSCNANLLEGDYSASLEGGSDKPNKNVICGPIEDVIRGSTNDGNEVSHEDTITKLKKDANGDQIKHTMVEAHVDVIVDPCADVPNEPKESIDLDTLGCESTEPNKDILTEPCQAVNEIPNEDDITAQHEDIAHPSETVKSNQDNNAVQDDDKDSCVENEDALEHSDNWNDETFDESIKWNDTTYDETTTNNDENFEETGTRNEESYNESMALNEESYNVTDDWHEESYNEMSEPFMETNGWNEESYNESLDKNGEGYNDSNDWNDETNNETGDKNDETCNIISDTNEKPYSETADSTDEIYNEMTGCNEEESYNETTSDWNEDSFNELGFWNGESHLDEEAYEEKDNDKVDEHDKEMSKMHNDWNNASADNHNEDATSYISQSTINSSEQSFGNSNDETLTDIYVHIDNENKQIVNNDFNGEQNETAKNSVIDEISSSENEISKKRHLPVDEEEIVPKKILKTTNNGEGNHEKKSLHETNNVDGKGEKEKSPLHERKNFACEKCANRYISNFTLERHRSVCKGLKIRACKQKDCKETFASRDDLKLHQKVHNVADLNNAEMVQAETKDASGLVTVAQAKDEKVEKAKDEKPFSCDFCLKRFKTKWYAQMHKETKHSK